MSTCLDAVKVQTFQDFEMIVVDNGSVDGTSDFIKKNYPWVRLIKNEANLGFAGGNNSAFPSCKGKYIALLNNDTQADRRWLEELVKVLEKNPDIFGVGSVPRHKYGREEWWFPGYGTSGFFGQPSIDTRIPKDFKGLVDVWGPGGGACLLRRPIDMLFDPDYFAYSEDFWNSWRFRLQGYKAVMNPKSTVLHEGEITGKRLKWWKIFYQERNRLLNALIAFEPWTLVRLAPLLAINIVATLIYDYPNAYARIIAHLWLLAHIPTILKKRSYLQSYRRVPDSKVIKYMSCVLYEESLITNRFLNRFVQAINRLQKRYCSLVHLFTAEFYQIKNGRLTDKLTK